MRTCIQLTADGGKWPELVDYATEAEKLGVDIVWVAEAWGSDAASTLGYLAGRTDRMLLGSGIFQVGVRSPVMVAQTAMTLALMSDNRFLLGLGASGPQVMEGMHGVSFAHPLGRTRETIEIIKLAHSGERIQYKGRHFQLPLPDGDGKALRVGSVPSEPVPIYLATLSPKMLQLTGEVADGWVGTSFVPEGADAYLDHIRTGAESAGRSLADIDICQGAEVAFARDEAELAVMIQRRKQGLAFSLGGMGSSTTNFYNNAYSRQGWEDVAAASQAQWLAGDRQAAADLIPDEMVLATTLLGTEEMVAARLKLWSDVGVNSVRLYPAGKTLEQRLDTLARALEMVP